MAVNSASLLVYRTQSNNIFVLKNQARYHKIRHWNLPWPFSTYRTPMISKSNFSKQWSVVVHRFPAFISCRHAMVHLCSPDRTSWLLSYGSLVPFQSQIHRTWAGRRRIGQKHSQLSNHSLGSDAYRLRGSAAALLLNDRLSSAKTVRRRGFHLSCSSWHNGSHYAQS